MEMCGEENSVAVNGYRQVKPVGKKIAAEEKCGKCKVFIFLTELNRD